MPIHRPKRNPVLAPHLVRKHVFDEEPLSLIDVGASGGIASFWSVFQPSFRAWGFDILVEEVDRLNGLNQQNVTYHAARVGAGAEGSPNGFDKTDDFESGPYVFPFDRSSAIHYWNNTERNYIQEKYNKGEVPTYTNTTTTIDDFRRNLPSGSVDFLKIDTDGHDMEVLKGAFDTLGDTALAVLVECSFHGKPSRRTNLFSNVDQFLLPLGFSLFDMDVWRYSKADLPRRYQYDGLVAQTGNGQVIWCDALFVRDIAAPGYEDYLRRKFSAVDILKTACFLEIMNLEDCAVELLKTFSTRIREQTDQDPKELSRLLMESIYGEGLSYDEYETRFSRVLRSGRNDELK